MTPDAIKEHLRPATLTNLRLSVEGLLASGRPEYQAFPPISTPVTSPLASGTRASDYRKFIMDSRRRPREHITVSIWFIILDESPALTEGWRTYEHLTSPES